MTKIIIMNESYHDLKIKVFEVDLYNIVLWPFLPANFDSFLCLIIRQAMAKKKGNK